jgi:hypothetical protein
MGESVGVELDVAESHFLGSGIAFYSTANQISLLACRPPQSVQSTASQIVFTAARFNAISS